MTSFPGSQPATKTGEQPSRQQNAQAAAKAPLMSVGPFRLRRTRHGLMMFNINDIYIGQALDIYGECDEFELSFLSQIIKPGDCVVDAGASIGGHSVFFAGAVGPKGVVISYEPQRVAHQLLSTNMMLNGHVNCVLNHAALGAAPGDVYVPRMDVNRPTNFGGIALNDEQEGERVRMVTLDSFNLKACKLIKIDVEGFERDVLRGAEGTIHTCRPFLYVENDSEAESPALLEKLFEMDYRLYWHLTNVFNPQNYYGVQNRIFKWDISPNIIAVPREKDIDIQNLREIRSLDDWWKRSAINPAQEPGDQG